MNRARNTGNGMNGTNMQSGNGMNGTGMRSGNGMNGTNMQSGNGMNGTGMRSGNGMNGTNMRSGNGQTAGRNNMARDSALLEEIRQLGFVKVELELYLDTHPNCRVALDYYHQTVDALNKLMDEYHATGNLVRAEGSVSDDTWEWVNTPWPWHRGDEDPDGWREER